MSRNTAVAAALLSLPIVAITACSSPQHASTQPGTTPPVLSGSPGSSTTPSAAPSGQALSAQLKAPDGRQVATATFEVTNGYLTITVKTDTPAFWRPACTGCTCMRSASVSRTRLPRPVARPGISCRRGSLSGAWSHRKA